MDRNLYYLKLLAGNAKPFRLTEQADEMEDTLEDFIQNYYKNSLVEVDAAKGLIHVSVQAETTLVDVSDMRRSEDYMNQVLQEYQARGGQNVQGAAQFVGIKSNDQFSVFLVFHVTENPTNFGA